MNTDNVIPMPSKEKISELVRDQLGDDQFIQQLADSKGDLHVFADGDEELSALRDELTEGLRDETMKIVSNLTDVLAKMHLGASMAIHNCRKACNLDPEGTDETSELTAMLQYQQAVALINQVNEVNRQSALLEYVANAGINYDIATNINFVERQYEQFKGAIRTYKLKTVDLDAVIAYARKHSNNQVIKARTAALYAVLRYFNEIRKQRQVVPNMIYISHTAAIVTAVFASKLDIPLLSQLPALIIGAEGSK